MGIGVFILVSIGSSPMGTFEKGFEAASNKPVEGERWLVQCEVMTPAAGK